MRGEAKAFWSRHKEIYKYKSLPAPIKEQVKEGGMPHEDDIVVVYPDGAFILVFGDGYIVTIGNTEDLLPRFHLAEDHLWDNWSGPNFEGSIYDEI